MCESVSLLGNLPFHRVYSGSSCSDIREQFLQSDEKGKLGTNRDDMERRITAGRLPGACQEEQLGTDSRVIFMSSNGFI